MREFLKMLLGFATLCVGLYCFAWYPLWTCGVLGGFFAIFAVSYVPAYIRTKKETLERTDWNLCAGYTRDEIVSEIINRARSEILVPAGISALFFSPFIIGAVLYFAGWLCTTSALSVMLKLNFCR